MFVARLPYAANAQLTINANFDHASLLSWSGNLSTINLVGRDNFFGSNKWRWVYFKASGVLGSNPTFSINGNLFAGDATPGPHELRDHEMVYSYDNVNWSFFENNNKGDTNFTFSNSQAFTQNEVYVAYAIPYSYGRSASHTQKVLASPWAAPTASADNNGVIGQSPARNDELGRAIPTLDLFAYRITNPATDSPTEAKRKVFLTSGLHAGETLGTYTYEGLIDWLISDDPRAARLRDTTEFFGYPVLNPSGRFAGLSRSTVGNPTRDPNGLWDPSRWSSSSFGCQNDNCQDIRASGEAMLADFASTPGNIVDAFIDFHSTVPDYTIDPVNGIPDDFGFVASEDTNTDWWLALQQLQPNLLEFPSGGGNFTTAGFARRLLNAQTEITIETQFSWERPIEYYHDFGANFGIAFFQAWITQVEGDFTGDGLVDAADYTAWRDGLGTLYTVEDFSLWKSNFGTLAGAGAAASFAVTVPEPGGSFLLLAASLSLLGRFFLPTRPFR